MDVILCTRSFVVEGVPKPWPRERIEVIQSSGRKKRLRFFTERGPYKAWRDAVRAAALEARLLRGGIPDVPLKLDVVFCLPIPDQKAPLPKKPVRKEDGDLDNLTKGVCDALQKAGLIRDDSRFWKVDAAKVWAGEDVEFKPGAWVCIRWETDDD